MVWPGIFDYESETRLCLVEQRELAGGEGGSRESRKRTRGPGKGTAGREKAQNRHSPETAAAGAENPGDFVDGPRERGEAGAAGAAERESENAGGCLL